MIFGRIDLEVEKILKIFNFDPGSSCCNSLLYLVLVS